VKRGSPTRQRLAALALLGIPLLTFPVLGLPQGEIAGIPAVFLYLFGVWAALIAFAARIAERPNK
jgi:hypothetical protein